MGAAYQWHRKLQCVRRTAWTKDDILWSNWPGSVLPDPVRDDSAGRLSSHVSCYPSLIRLTLLCSSTPLNYLSSYSLNLNLILHLLLPFHPSRHLLPFFWRCCECGCILSHWYYEREAQLYCKKHYWNRYGEHCHGCKETIATGLIMVTW